VSDLSTTAGQGGSKRPRPRVQASLAFVQRVRPALYALLVASALLSFWAGNEIQGRRVPAGIGSAAPILFGAFLLIFAVYRLALIRARHYPASTGLFQIGLGALVFVLLLPGSRRAISARSRAAQSGGDDVLELLDAGDPRVRALAAEVAADRGQGPRYAPELAARLDDSDVHVRAVARASLIRLLKLELPADTGEDATDARIRSELGARGWLPAHP